MECHGTGWSKVVPSVPCTAIISGQADRCAIAFSSLPERYVTRLQFDISGPLSLLFSVASPRHVRRPSGVPRRGRSFPSVPKSLDRFVMTSRRFSIEDRPKHCP
jgi:hypothetical protein